MKTILSFKKYCFSLMMVLGVVYSQVYAQSITLDPISTASFCYGATINVSLVASGTFGHHNAFTIQLSDPNGSFTSGFRNIGSDIDSTAGAFTISCSIPSDIAPSSHYRIRAMAAVPFITSSDNGSDLAVNALPADGLITANPALMSTTDSIAFRYSSDDNNSIFPTGIHWDFGDGASPQTADNSFTPSMIYATPGTKTVTITTSNASGCTTTQTALLQVYSCATPVIPRNAIVIDSDQTLNGSGKTYWVNPGITVTLSGMHDTAFCEPGSNVIATGLNCMVYAKSGASATDDKEANVIIFANGAGVLPNNQSTLNCPNLNFDYSQAPPNKISVNAVSETTSSNDITIYPNPASRTMTLSVPHFQLIQRISVLNELGSSVMEFEHPSSSQLNLDISMLPVGAYYVRIQSSNGVITKKLLHQ